MNRYEFLVVAMIIVACAGAAYSATNYVQEGDVVTLTWSSTSPTAGDPVLKCAAKATGGIVGVALNGSAVANENVQVATKGVFKLNVTASTTISDIAPGDFIYGSVGGITTCTTTLSNDSDGLLFGVALEAAIATTTSPVYRNIKVKLVQPGHL